MADPGDVPDIVIASMTVAQILIRQLEDDTKAKLQRLARKHGRSTEEEAREILRNAVRHVDAPPGRLGSRIAARFKGAGLTEDIAELRGQEVRPAQFDEL
jgi:plasmid stability protein